MRLKNIIRGAVVLVLGISGVAFAGDDYYPPERIHCQADNTGKMICSDFNRQYLVESTRTADLPAGKDAVFNFATGSAFKSSENEWVVFYSYKDSFGKNVRLKTIDTSIQPDTQNGAWKAYKDFFICTAGHMSCPITRLPSLA